MIFDIRHNMKCNNIQHNNIIQHNIQHNNIIQHNIQHNMKCNNQFINWSLHVKKRLITIKFVVFFYDVLPLLLSRIVYYSLVKICYVRLDIEFFEVNFFVSVPWYGCIFSVFLKTDSTKTLYRFRKFIWNNNVLCLHLVVTIGKFISFVITSDFISITLIALHTSDWIYPYSHYQYQDFIFPFVLHT